MKKICAWLMLFSLGFFPVVFATGSVSETGSVVETTDSSTSSGAGSVADIDDMNALLSELDEVKDGLFGNLDAAVGQVLDKVETAYDDFSLDEDYRSMVCLGVVDFDVNVEDIQEGADLLKSEILKEHSTISAAISYQKDSYDNDLISESTYDLSLQTKATDINDFSSNYGSFVDTFYQGQLDTIASLYSQMDAYKLENADELQLVTQRTHTLDSIKDAYASLEQKKSDYLQYFGTVLGIDDVHDNLLDSLRDDVNKYFGSQTAALLEKYDNFIGLTQLLADEEEILQDKVEVELRRYMDDLVRYYDGDQYEILEQYMTTLDKLYYLEDDFYCQNIVGDRDVPITDAAVALIDDLDAALSAGYENFGIVPGVTIDEEVFGENLQEEYDRIIKNIVSVYDERTDALIERLLGSWSQQRVAFKDLLRSKVEEFDASDAATRNVTRNSYVSKAMAIGSQAVGKKMQYDVQVFLYSMGELVYLDMFAYHNTSRSIADYLREMYLDYLSDESLVSTLILPQRFNAYTKYKASSIETKLRAMKAAYADDDAFNTLLSSAIEKAKLMLMNDAVGLKTKATVNEIMIAMKRVVN